MALISAVIVTALAVPLVIAFAILVHPPLFNEVRPFLIPLAAIGLIATALGAWLIWWRD